MAMEINTFQTMLDIGENVAIKLGRARNRIETDTYKTCAAARPLPLPVIRAA